MMLLPFSSIMMSMCFLNKKLLFASQLTLLICIFEMFAYFCFLYCVLMRVGVVATVSLLDFDLGVMDLKCGNILYAHIGKAACS